MRAIDFQCRNDQRAPENRWSEQGMTMVELLVASVISLILMTAIIQFFVIQTQNMNESRVTSEMQQELRWASTFMADRLKLAGNGVPPTSWFRVINNADGGADGTDSVFVVAVYKSLVLTTTQNMGNEGSQVKVNNTDNIEVGDLICISYPPNGWQEVFMVTKIASDQHLYHDAQLPWNDTNKLDHKYPAGSLCSVVTAYSFFVQTDQTGHSNLMVQTQAYRPQILAGDIDDFQIKFKLKDNSWVNNPVEVSDVRMMEISVRARTPDPLKGYTDVKYGDEYKRIELKTKIIPKNIVFVAD
jgi:prepilin-type N-terminal cleavage/methylation domain-containing protein